MENHARITEKGIDAKVIHIIPRSGVLGQAQVEIRQAGMLGCRCSDYVLEGRLEELHELRKKGAISRKKFEERYFGLVSKTVDSPQNQEYVRDFKVLMNRHQKYFDVLSAGEQLKEIYQLMEEYK